MKAVSINLAFTNNTNESQIISFFNGGAQLDLNVGVESQTIYSTFGGLAPYQFTFFEVTIGDVLFSSSLSIANTDSISEWDSLVQQLNLSVPVATFQYIVNDPNNQDTWELTCTSNFSFGNLTFTF
jgi:hypothetical protein